MGIQILLNEIEQVYGRTLLSTRKTLFIQRTQEHTYGKFPKAHDSHWQAPPDGDQHAVAFMANMAGDACTEHRAESLASLIGELEMQSSFEAPDVMDALALLIDTQGLCCKRFYSLLEGQKNPSATKRAAEYFKAIGAIPGLGASSIHEYRRIYVDTLEAGRDIHARSANDKRQLTQLGRLAGVDAFSLARVFLTDMRNEPASARYSKKRLHASTQCQLEPALESVFLDILSELPKFPIQSD